MQDLIKKIISLRLGKVLVNERISNYTTYKVGGKAKAIIYPNNEDDLVTLVKLLKENDVKYFILGNGSNVLFSDNLYNGIIIKLDMFNKVEIKRNIISVGAGYQLIKLANLTIKNGLAGLDFAAGIPGTVGGAVFMNAGAYGEDMSNIVEEVTVLDSDCNIIKLNNKEMEFSYRTTILQKHLDWVCLSCKLKLHPGDIEELTNVVMERKRKRIDTQPLNYPQAGCVFRNPEGNFAGKMIEEMGLKGFSIGKAEVSTKHANFIINKGNCTAKDIKNIIDTIKAKAFSKYGVHLRVEQRLINWDGIEIKDEEEKED